ncbi:hypothetical protein CYG49_02540 [Candidatus Saccharibacteria bacterium]|nr:MAG: hypothetical protein CYG49_02540 [Candidatus Saccharibacteria bacterium]
MSEQNAERILHFPPFEGSLAEIAHIKRGAEVMRSGQALVVDNDCVWAVWGNPEDPRFLKEVERLKGRDPNRPYGLTISTAQFLELADLDRVDPSVRPLLEDAEELAARLGAMTFIRMPGKQTKIVEWGMPASLVSRDDKNYPVVQNYDSAGKADVAQLLELARQDGPGGKGIRFPAVTSLNRTAQSEIIEPEEAITFSREFSLPVIADEQAKRCGTGSYAIIEFNEQGMCLLREGNISNDLLRRLLHPYPLHISPEVKKAKGEPFDGSGIPELKGLVGAELRIALLHHFGWDRCPK